MSCCVKSILPSVGIQGPTGAPGPIGPVGPQGPQGPEPPVAPQAGFCARQTGGAFPVATNNLLYRLPFFPGGLSTLAAYDNSLGNFNFPDAFTFEIAQDGHYQVNISCSFVFAPLPSTAQTVQLALTDSALTFFYMNGQREIVIGAQQNEAVAISQSFYFNAGTLLSVAIQCITGALPGASVIDGIVSVTRLDGQIGATGGTGATGPTAGQIRAIARYNIDASGGAGPAGGLAFDPTTTVPGPFNVPWSPLAIGLGLAEPFVEDPDGYFTLTTPQVLTFNQTGKYQISTGMAILSTENLGPVGAQILYNGQSVFSAAPGCGSFGSPVGLTGAPVFPTYPYAYSLGCDTSCSITAGDTVSIVLYAGGGAGGITSEIAQASNLCVKLITGPGEIDAWRIGGNTTLAVGAQRLGTNDTFLDLFEGEASLVVGGTATTRPNLHINGSLGVRQNYSTATGTLALPPYEFISLVRDTSTFVSTQLPTANASGNVARAFLINSSLGTTATTGASIVPTGGNGIVVQGIRTTSGVILKGRSTALAVEIPGASTWAVLTQTPSVFHKQIFIPATPDPGVVTDWYVANTPQGWAAAAADGGAHTQPANGAFNSTNNTPNLRLENLSFSWDSSNPGAGNGWQIRIYSDLTPFPAGVPALLLQTYTYTASGTGQSYILPITMGLVQAGRFFFIRITNIGTGIPIKRCNIHITGATPGPA